MEITRKDVNKSGPIVSRFFMDAAFISYSNLYQSVLDRMNEPFNKLKKWYK